LQTLLERVEAPPMVTSAVTIRIRKARARRFSTDPRSGNRA